ncbi:hypothetical protein [Guptibacillus hwajinpoensis]|uniref:Uncharacterized protein n=1 Tax=Guptibacillus hwajinpoensis TaxID=208199 RepID=A0A0J6D413_9BACL|nr:hypothetical protein [Alkalihalobacillus macyae]KMM39039.1 hypothetical protein AB986_07335 [Alkalihalobacillus macyae]
MKKIILLCAVVGFLFVGINPASANPTTYGPYYTTFSGSQLTSSSWGTLARKCENAVNEYGSYISSSSNYTCKWSQQIESRVTSTNGRVVNVSYSPYYIYFN